MPVCSSDRRRCRSSCSSFASPLHFEPECTAWRESRLDRPSHREVHRHALALGEAVEHALERELAADAALLVAAVGHAGHLAAALVDLHPARFDGMRGAQAAADVVRPDIGGEAVAGASAAEKTALFSGTAQRVYR